MAGSDSKPKVSVQVEGTDRREDHGACDDYLEQGKRTRKRMDRARGRAQAWLDGAAPGHANAVIFGLLGLAAALTILFVGFFQALLMVVLVMAGVAFGQWLDGDPKIVNGLRRLFRSRDGS